MNLSLAEYTEIIDKALNELEYPVQPVGLYEPVHYILGLGGKRIRPALTLMATSIFSDDALSALPAALALEIFHNFTLMHDDIMDKADVRRGRETVHKKWNDNTAILSGDAAVIIAYNQLGLLPENLFKQAYRIFNRTALEVCEGQQFDMNFETRQDVSIAEYMEMIRLKTSVLIAAAMEIGAVCGGANPLEQEAMYRIGENIGLAFQLQDDYLDVFSETEKFGKENGGDIVNNKKTYLLISALNSDDKNAVAELNGWLNKTEFKKEEKISAVKDIYVKLGIDNDVQLAAINFINSAIELLNELNVPLEKKKPLEDLIFNLMYREK